MDKKFKIAIIDYEMGNLFSVQRACEHIGVNAVITEDKSAITKADGVILPGVGAFGDAMVNLKKKDLIKPIKDFIETGKPFMGICLGLQLLFSESEEFGIHTGLDIIKGSVIKFPVKNPNGEMLRVPQVGWNRIFKPDITQEDWWDETPLKNLSDGEFMYFVHSYYAVPSETEIVLSTTSYEGVPFCSSILWKNVFACQFHPEKSAVRGLRIYENWFQQLGATRSVKAWERD